MKNKKPLVRFKGFEDDWESFKLEQLFVKGGSGGTPKSTEKSYYQGNIPFLSITDISKSDGYINDTEKHISSEGLNNSSAWIVPSGSISLAMYASVGKLAILNVESATSQAFFNMIFSDNILRDFVYHRLNKANDLQEWNKLISTGTQANLNADKVKNFTIKLPNSIHEREAIASLFNIFNSLINSTEQELERLKLLKKGLLQKMFPKKGRNTPEIRFDGFTGAWEQRKVGDFYDFKNGLNKGKEFFGSGTPIVNFTDVFNNRGIYFKKLLGRVMLEPNEIKNFEVKKGDLFFTRTSETILEIGYSSVMLDVPKNTVFSGFVLRGRCFLNEDPLVDQFKKYVFFTDYFRQEMIKKSSMTTRALTSGTAIKNMEFLYPRDKDEQYKIGQYFTLLDDLITLHQRKLDTLKLQKKSLLQKMFV